jgi:hypothetical protein
MHIMKGKYIAVACIAVSLALLLSLIAGSFVTYTPSVSATDIQNRYIARIVWYGGASCAFQTAALIAVTRKARGATDILP